MSIHVALEHSNRYIFDRPVNLSPHVIRLRPAPHSRTPILAYSLKVTPEDHFINWQQDPFGNFRPGSCSTRRRPSCRSGST